METKSELSKALDARSDVDYKAYQLLMNEILEVVKYEPFKTQFTNIFKEWHEGEWDEAGEELIKKIEQIKKDRIQANENIMTVIKNLVNN